MCKIVCTFATTKEITNNYNNTTMFTLLMLGMFFWIFWLAIKICWTLICLIFSFFGFLTGLGGWDDYS